MNSQQRIYTKIVVPSMIAKVKKIDLNDPAVQKRLEYIQQEQLDSIRRAGEGKRWRRMFPVKR